MTGTHSQIDQKSLNIKGLFARLQSQGKHSLSKGLGPLSVLPRILTTFALLSLFLPLCGEAALEPGDFVVVVTSSDASSPQILRISSDFSTVEVLAELDGLTDPRDIAVSETQTVYVLDGGDAESKALSPSSPQEPRGGLYRLDQQTGNLSLVSVPSTAGDLSAVEILPGGEAVIADPFPITTDGSTASAGVTYHVDLQTGESRSLVQTNQISRPTDLSLAYDNAPGATGGDFIILDPRNIAEPDARMYLWRLDQGDYVEVPPFAVQLEATRMNSSPFGLALLGDAFLLFAPPSRDSALLLGPTLNGRFIDVAWSADGVVTCLEERSGADTALVDVINAIKTDRVVSADLNGAVALSLVPPRTRRVGVLESPLSEGAGGNVNVEIAISKLSDTGSLDLRIDFDPELVLVGNPVFSSVVTDNLFHDASVNNVEGWIDFAFLNTSLEPISGLDEEGEGVQIPLAVIPFTLRAAAGLQESVPLFLSRDAGDLASLDINGESIELTPVDGEIHIIQGLLGDINDDGDVSSGDAILALQHAVGKRTLSPIQLIRGDMNGDGAVNSSDALLILRTSTGYQNPQGL